MSCKIAIIGTNGIPSKYGGFETLVEYLVLNLAEKYEITVFCSTKLNKEKIANVDKKKQQQAKKLMLDLLDSLQNEGE